MGDLQAETGGTRKLLVKENKRLFQATSPSFAGTEGEMGLQEILDRLLKGHIPAVKLWFHVIEASDSNESLLFSLSVFREFRREGGQLYDQRLISPSRQEGTKSTATGMVLPHWWKEVGVYGYRWGAGGADMGKRTLF